MRSAACIVLLIGTVAAVSDVSADEIERHGSKAVHEWPMIAGNAGWTGYSPDDRVRPPLRLRWATKTFGCLKSAAVVAGGRVFVKSYQGSLLCFDAEAGRVLWEREDLGLGVNKNFSPSSDGRRVFITDARYGLLAVDAASGELLWRKPGGGLYAARSSPAFKDGVVYWGLRDKQGTYLCARKTADGEIVWRTRLGDGVNPQICTPSLAGDLVLCSMKNPTATFALEQKTGHEVWRTEGVRAAQVVGTDGVHAWTARANDGVTALDAKTGAKLWHWGGLDSDVFKEGARRLSPAWLRKAVLQKPFYARAGTASWAPTVAYGKLFFKAYGGFFSVLNPADGKLQWTFDDEAGTGCAVPSAAGGYLYFATGNYNPRTGGGRAIYAIDPRTRKPVWRHRTGGRTCAAPAIAYGRLYVPSNDGRLYCFEPCAQVCRPPAAQAAPAEPAAPPVPLARKSAGKPGAPRRQDKPPGGKDWPMYGGCPARCGLEIKIGLPIRPAWKFLTGGIVRSSPVIAGGVVYVGSDSGRLFALELATGAKKWAADIGFRVRSAPAVASGVVVCGADDGTLRAFSAADGKPKWAFRTGGPILASPAVVGERVVFGSFDEHCYCLRLTDGAEFWRYRAGHEIHAPPAVADGVVYVGAWEWRLHALDLGAGRPVAGFTPNPRRRYEPSGACRFEGIALYRGVLATCCPQDESYGRGHAFDAGTGKELVKTRNRQEEFRFARNGFAFGAAAFSGRWMFIPNAWKGTGVIDLEDGTYHGERGQCPSPMLNTPLVTGDLMFAATRKGTVEVRGIYAGDRGRPAKLLWQWTSPSGRKIATAPAAAGGHIVLGSDDGNVYGFRYTEPQ